MIGIIAARVASLVEEEKARKRWLDSLPKEEAVKIRAADAAKARELELHKRALEIAEAGRPRNFWGW